MRSRVLVAVGRLEEEDGEPTQRSSASALKPVSAPASRAGAELLGPKANYRQAEAGRRVGGAAWAGKAAMGGLRAE